MVFEAQQLFIQRREFMDQDSDNEVVQVEQDYDQRADERETEEIRRRIESFGQSKRRKTELVRWIKKTPDGLYREKQIWHAIQYFNRLKDFDMSRRLADLETHAVERATAFYLIAIATNEEKDILIARQQLAVGRSAASSSRALAKIGRHYAGLFRITDDPRDLARATRIAESLMGQSEYDYAGDVFMDIVEVHSVTGFFLQAFQASILTEDGEYRSYLLERLYSLLEICPPLEGLGPLIDNLITNPDPDVQEMLQPFVTHRICGAVYCALYWTKRPVGLA